MLRNNTRRRAIAWTSHEIHGRRGARGRGAEEGAREDGAEGLGVGGGEGARGDERGEEDAEDGVVGPHARGAIDDGTRERGGGNGDAGDGGEVKAPGEKPEGGVAAERAHGGDADGADADAENEGQQNIGAAAKRRDTSSLVSKSATAAMAKKPIAARAPSFATHLT